MTRRVAITGVGAVTPLGVGARPLLERWAAGESGIRDGLLKRPDEKYVTERAYDNPKFVEDLVRDVAVALDRDPRVGAYVVEAENFESIHNHSAFARIVQPGSAPGKRQTEPLVHRSPAGEKA